MRKLTIILCLCHLSFFHAYGSAAEDKGKFEIYLRVERVLQTHDFVKELIEESRLLSSVLEKREDVENARSCSYLDNSGNQDLAEYVEGVVSKLFSSSGISWRRYQKHERFCLLITDEPHTYTRFQKNTFYFSKNLMKMVSNEAELAFIIGHEMSHMLLHHWYRQAFLHKKNEILANKYGSNNTDNRDSKIINDKDLIEDQLVFKIEREADELAIKLLLNADYDPKKAVLILKNLRWKDGSNDNHLNLVQLNHLLKFVLNEFETQRNKATTKPLYLVPKIPDSLSHKESNWLDIF